MNQKRAHFVTDKTDESLFLTLSSVTSVADRALFEKYAEQLKQLKSYPPELSQTRTRYLRGLIESVCLPDEVEEMLGAALPFGEDAIKVYEEVKADRELILRTSP